MRMRFLSLGTLAVLAAPGCADDAGGGAEPSATTHAAALSAATCEAVFACPAGSELGALRALLPEGVPACLATFHQRDAQARVLARIARSNGALRFDPAAAARCYERVKSTCSLRGEAAAACADVLRGAAADGAPCLDAAGCGEGLFCLPRPGEACGVCRPAVPIGGACRGTIECDPRGARGSVRCVGPRADGATVCADVVAAPDAPEGAACGRGWTGPSVVSEVRCGPGLRCGSSSSAYDPSRVGAGVCERACGEGADPLGAGCGARVWRHQEGDECDSEGVAGACNPLRRLACQQGACRRVSGAEGEPCLTVGPPDATCDPGLTCRPGPNGDRSRCRRPAALGEACRGGDDCASGVCLGYPGTCRAPACDAVNPSGA